MMAKNLTKNNNQNNRKVISRVSNAQTPSTFIDQNQIPSENNTIHSSKFSAAPSPIISNAQIPSDLLTAQQSLELNLSVATFPQKIPIELTKRSITIHDSSLSMISQSSSSDNLKDAVRKWHAKRKKDFSLRENSEFKKIQEEIETTNNISTRKVEQKKSNIVTNCDISNEANSNPQFIYEQKRPRGNIETETNKKGPFDGPLSFETIMALKRKKITNSNEKLDGKNMKNTFDDSTNDVNHFTKNIQSINESTHFNLKTNCKISDEIKHIQSKSVDLINGFNNCNTSNEILRVFITIIDYLSTSLGEIISNCDRSSSKENMRIGDSLEVCMNIVSRNNDSINEDIDELALRLFAKYPTIFESLKTLTNVNILSDLLPDNIYKYILKYTLIIDQINKGLQKIN